MNALERNALDRGDQIRLLQEMISNSLSVGT